MFLGEEVEPKIGPTRDHPTARERRGVVAVGRERLRAGVDHEALRRRPRDDGGEHARRAAPLGRNALAHLLHVVEHVRAGTDLGHADNAGHDASGRGGPDADLSHRQAGALARLRRLHHVDPFSLGDELELAGLARPVGMTSVRE